MSTEISVEWGLYEYQVRPQLSGADYKSNFIYFQQHIAMYLSAASSVEMVINWNLSWNGRQLKSQLNGWLCGHLCLTQDASWVLTTWILVHLTEISAGMSTESAEIPAKGWFDWWCGHWVVSWDLSWGGALSQWGHVWGQACSGLRVPKRTLDYGGNCPQAWEDVRVVNLRNNIFSIISFPKQFCPSLRLHLSLYLQNRWEWNCDCKW